MPPRRRRPAKPAAGREEAQASPVPKEALRDHAGRWVALKNGRVVAAADNAKDLLAHPDVDAEATPFFVPHRDELF